MKKKIAVLLLSMLMVVEPMAINVHASSLSDAMNTDGITLGTVASNGTNEISDDAETPIITVSENEADATLIAEATYTNSGSPSIAKMSKNSIANYLNAIYTKNLNLMSIQPSVVAPHSPGSPSTEHMNYALASVNLMRQMAGLPVVSLKDEYNTYAQYGAVLLAASGRFEHVFQDSQKPADMAYDFFNIGRTGTSRSNISMGTAPYYNMPKFTTGYMQDHSGSNVPIVGHRRWILNPEMKQTGFGYAVSTSSVAYSAMYAFDTTAAAVDYDFISWPSSGNFPNTIMGAGDPWSITLNPNKFKSYSSYLNMSSITVTVTAPNGVAKTFTSADNAANINNSAAAYFNVDHGGYGVSNCIVFRPGTAIFGSASLSGKYTVVVSGLTEVSTNAPATICYTIDFYNPQDYITNPNANINELNSNTAPANETAVEGYVNRLYSKCLGRDGDAEGILYWKDLLMNGRSTGARAAQGFFFSREMNDKNLTDEEFVEVLYNVMLDRHSDEEGMAYWLKLMDQGMSRSWVFSKFAISPEFTGICKSYGITRGEATITEARDRNYGATQFIARCYTKALGRKYDVEGLNYWCQALLEGRYTAANIASTQFFNSKEFKNKNLGDREYLEVLYRTFMGREYDEEGMEYWLTKMRVDGTSRDGVLKAFAESKEFRGIMSAYGLQ